MVGCGTGPLPGLVDDRGYTDPSHLGPQANVAPSSLYLASSHAGMPGGDVVTALRGTSGCPGAGHAQGLAAGPGSLHSHKATWVWDSTVLGACRNQHCLEQSFGVYFQLTQGPWRTWLPQWRRCQERRGTCRMEERRCPVAQALMGGCSRVWGLQTRTPLARDTLRHVSGCPR